MKCITAFYNVATDDEIMEILAEVGIEEYSKIPRCQGKGQTTGPRLDSHVWPGFNITLIMVVDDAVAPKLMRALQAFRDGPTGRRTGIYAYQTAVEAALTPPVEK